MPVVTSLRNAWLDRRPTRRNQTMFYATKTDMTDVLASLEAIQPFQYTLTGLFREREPLTLRSCRDIPDLGIASHPTAIASPAYLMSLQGETVDVREVPQKAGGMRFAIDQRANANTTVIRPGGRYGDRVILHGTFDTISLSQHALTLYGIVSKLLRQKFQPVEECLVGPDAFRAWKEGARLTIAVQSHTKFDLGSRGGR